MDKIFRTFFLQCEKSTFIKLMVSVNMTCVILYASITYVKIYTVYICTVCTVYIETLSPEPFHFDKMMDGESTDGDVDRKI